ncbi:MAG: hypothetical protein A3G41_05910 [Elusimicrobia bacterium RIFCSPLOWO2_12_FULL_59_9]|nr:MAG: hypothetical protein A3G41_05910 [Elusimicrobia bacterium RIFCSPLOWO2_12_FULL_59_9]
MRSLCFALFAAGLLISTTQAGKAAESATPPYWRPWNEVQAYAPDLAWKADDIPKAVFDALPKWMTQKDREGHLTWSSPVAFASVDLDGDGIEELIVRSGEPFSGGPQFAILRRSGNRWRTIGEIQGGFTISKRSTKGFADIETWSRHPETYHFLWKFSGGRYKAVREEKGPWKDRGLDPPYVPSGKF